MRACITQHDGSLPLTGTASGGLYALQCPDLQNYANVRAHRKPVLGLAALGDGAASVSDDWLRFHGSGGLPRALFTAAQVEAGLQSAVPSAERWRLASSEAEGWHAQGGVEGFACVAAEAHSKSRVLLGCMHAPMNGASLPGNEEAGTLAVVDLAAGSVMSKVLRMPAWQKGPTSTQLQAVHIFARRPGRACMHACCTAEAIMSMQAQNCLRTVRAGPARHTCCCLERREL